ncbi:MAG: DNA polymerase III subunit beta [Candidatus Latescibacteria bacterium]|nr:DNA polymerase III subunit beta [Candidatus Latescibacterota bacterium]
MKIKIEQVDFWKQIQKVFSIVPTRTTLPILSNILLDAEKDSLSIAATDLDVSICTKMPAQTEEPGSITVPARKFAEVLRELPSCLLSLESDGDRVWLLSDRGRYGLIGMPAEDFPRLPSKGEGTSFQPEGEVLSDIIDKTIFAVSTDESRPALTGVFFKGNGEQIDIVATDGHRLARVSRDMSVPLSPFEAIVPPKALSHLTRLISGGEELDKVTVGETYITFDLGETQLYSRLIEGPYPDIERVIPRSNEKRMVVDNEGFSSAIRRVSALSDSDTHQVCFSIRKGSVRLSASSQEMGGEATEEVDVQYDNEDLDIGYNANYVLEILRRMRSEKVVFELDTPTSAGIIRPIEQPEGEDYLCLIMPLRLND